MEPEPDAWLELDVEVEDVPVLIERVSGFKGEDGVEGRRVRGWCGLGGVYARCWWYERERRWFVGFEVEVEL